MRSRRADLRDGLILAALAGIVFGLTWPLWRTHPGAQAAIGPGDMTIYYYPFTRYAIESLRAGQLPLWNPAVLGGHPFLAEMQTQVLYPFRWLTALLTLGAPLSYRAFAAETVAHLALAAWGAYGFFRWLSRNRAAAAFGAVAWALSGYLTGYPLQAPPILATAAWLPWLLWAMGRALTGNRFRRRNVILATLCWMLIFISGFAQTALYVYGIALLWGLLLVLSRPRTQRRAALLTLALIIVIGSGLTAAQVLPTLEATSLSERLDLPEAERFAGFKFAELLGLALPHVTLWSPLYLGIPTLILAGLAVRRRPFGPRHSGLWWGLALFGLLLALGNTTPFLPILARTLPVVGMFRNPERAAVITAWALTTLAVLGWQTPIPRGYQRALALLWAASGLLLAGLFLWTRGRPEAAPFQGWFERLLWPWLMLGGSWLALRRWPATRWALVTLLAIDLGGTAWRTAQHGHFVWKDPAQVAAIPLANITLPADVQLHRVDTRGHLTGNWPAVAGLQDLHGHLTFENRFWMRFREEVPGDRVWALMGVGCGVWSADEPAPPWAMRQIAAFTHEGASLRLLCLEQPFPRYRMMYDAAPLEDGIALGVLADHRYDPTRTVLLEPAVTPLSTAAPPISPTITLRSQQPEAIRLEVQTAAPGYLVIGDLWYPGWNAYVNGARVPVLRAYTALRVVELPAGEHEVLMRYEPLSFRLGVGISLLSLLALLVWALRIRSQESKVTFHVSRVTND